MEALGGIYGPYTGRWFESTSETDIEHMVARSEAHDSGMCNMSDARKKEFSKDLLNLTLASPSVNRQQKSAKDAADWLPDLNECWFLDRVVQVREKYNLSIDQREADAIDAVLDGCSSVALVYTDRPTPTPSALTRLVTTGKRLDYRAAGGDLCELPGEAGRGRSRRRSGARSTRSIP